MSSRTRSDFGGVANERIAEQLAVSGNTVLTWRRRYGERGMAGLADAPRSGRPRRLDHRAIVATTLKPPPKKYGVTHWSSRLLAAHLGVGNATIARAWREYGVQPWRSGTFKFSTDPELVAKVTDVYGSYRIIRGGGWSDPQWSCRAGVRRKTNPAASFDDLGFRIGRGVSSALAVRRA